MKSTDRSTRILHIRLPRSIENRLEKLARQTGKTKSFFAREAILLHLQDLEDVFIAERALLRIQQGKDRAIPLEEVLKRYSPDG